MAAGSGKISELAKIAAITTNTKFELVDQGTDNQGLDNFYGDGLQLEQFVIRSGGQTRTALTAAVDAEKQRAMNVEGPLTSLQTENKNSLTAAINTVKVESDANAQQVTILQGRADALEEAAAAALPRADVVNDLESGGTAKALSAEQGKTLSARIAALSSGQAGRGVVRNAYTPQGESFRLTQVSVSAGGLGYAAGDALFLHGSDSFIPATVIVTAVDGSGAITAAELSMPGSFPADVSGADVPLAGGGGTGAAFGITAEVEPNTVLADIPTPAPNDFAFVLEDETHGGNKWRYSNLDYNGDGIYNWVPVIELGDTGRDFITDPIAAGELASNAVTEAKLADGAVTPEKQADIALTGVTADTADFNGNVSGSFAAVFTSLIRKTRGLFASTVKNTGNETIAGVKTFSSPPVLPAASTLPSSPSGTRPATEAQALDAAVRKTASVNASVWGSGTVNDEQGRTWEHNACNPLFVRGSVLSNGRSGAGSRIELDLNIQCNLWCSVNLAAGAEIVFLSVPVNLQWNAGSVLGGGSVGTEWLADSAPVSNAAGYAWAFPAPLLIEETGKQITGSKVCNNMAVALAYSGGDGTPGQLYAYGGLRVLADLSNPVLFFNGHMRIGFTRA